ncbi:MAG: hypothetical protein ACP5IE_03540 [Infirmifilum sp.]
MGVESKEATLSREDLMYVDYIKKFIVDVKRGRVDRVSTRDNTIEIIGVDSTGARLAVRLISSRIPISYVNTEVTHEAHEAEEIDADYVYLAIPSKKLIYIAKRTREILKEKGVGLIEVYAHGDTVEVMSSSLRIQKPVQPKSPVVERIIQPRLSEEVRLPANLSSERPEMPSENIARPSTVDSEEKIPDFVKDNPWLSVLSRRKAGGG